MKYNCATLTVSMRLALELTTGTTPMLVMMGGAYATAVVLKTALADH